MTSCPSSRVRSRKDQAAKSFIFDDNANLNALRYGDWKISFAQIEGNLFTGRRVTTNVPIVTNLLVECDDAKQVWERRSFPSFRFA